MEFKLDDSSVIVLQTKTARVCMCICICMERICVCVYLLSLTHRVSTYNIYNLLFFSRVHTYNLPNTHPENNPPLTTHPHIHIQTIQLTKQLTKQLPNVQEGFRV